MNDTSVDFPLNISMLGSPGRPPWYEDEACAAAPYGFVFYFAVKVFNLAIGFPANAMVMWLVATNKSGSSSDIFIFSLAVLDGYFCLMTPIEMVNRLVLGDSGIWYFQRFAYGVKDVAPLFLMCICLDRYFAVVFPILFTGLRDNRIRIVVTAVMWGLIVAHGLTKSFLGAMSVNDVFSGLVLSGFILMVFCNLNIMWVLRRSVAGKENMNPVKKKAFKMVLIVLGITTVCYLPVALMPFASYYSFVTLKCQISITVFSIMDLSCSIEPLLYISKLEQIACCKVQQK
ncbi:lysophosphatidic acid receptor 4 isoform X2 [Denticeps clupeoides]|nr:lysophosphatidic acid receptor 4-like isoform X2 [Denticeps clupeoides]